MNKNKFTEFFKGKGYYVLLFVGVLAIAAVAVVGSQLSSNEKEKGQNYVNLNDTQDDAAVDEGNDQLAENNPVSDGFANNGGSSSDSTVTNEDANEAVESNGNQVEYEGYSNETPTDTDQATANPATADDSKAVSEDSKDSVETAGNAVQEDTSLVAENLTFNKENDKLLWPVKGNVLMDYSMDHTIYFETLMEYKCNPAIIIDAEVGTEVKAAAQGIVSSIDASNEETGYTITMNIGDKYSLVYGQLNKDSVSLVVGDSVNEGDVIGTIAVPTKYYSIEGSNLYFQVMEEDATVNPMLLLR